ncbi:MAG: portal protein, partial [Bryobacteraceae bacterium]
MSSADQDKFISLARERFAHAEAEESEIRREAMLDLQYLAGEQWDETDKTARKNAGRPALVFNKLPGFVGQVANESRQQKQMIKFNPVDSGADKDTAIVYGGLARHIQYNSDADIARENAVEYSAGCSFGVMRLTSDYADDDSFDNQDLKVTPVLDPFSVYGVLIPAIFGRKCRCAFVVETMKRDDYEAEYGEIEASSWEGTAGSGWLTEDEVRIAEYWYLETKKRVKVQLADGSAAYEDELPEGAELAKDEKGKPRKRSCMVDEVHSCKMDGARVLPDTDTTWPDREIPVWPVLGRQLIVNGRAKLFSVIRFARDPQQLFNYYKSSIAEVLSLAPKTPYIGYLGQFKTKSREWATANKVNYAYLEADPVTISGQPAPLPQRQLYEAPIQALSAAAAQEADDMKATTSIYDASLGAQGNETSGIAIQRRQQQSSITNLHFLDNLARTERRIGRAIARLIPSYYDTARDIQILGEDESQRVVKVNQIYEEEGKVRHYRIDAGKYDLVATTAPSYPTQRLEAFDMLTQFAQAYPALLQIAGDIVFRNSDMPGADELADRFKKTLPPNLAADDKDKPPPQIPPQVQQQMQMMMQ